MSLDITHIKVLKQLPLRIAVVHGSNCRAVLRSLDTLCIIKALWVDCPMPVSNEPAKCLLASVSKLSVKQIERRLDDLQQLGWLTSHIQRGHDAISWDSLCQKYGIAHKHFYQVPVECILPGQRLYKILVSKVKFEKITECERAYRARVKHNKPLKETLDEVAGNAFNAKAVAYHQLRCFAFEGVLYDDDSRYVLSTHFTSKEEKILRADVQLNYCSWSNLLGFKSRGGYAKLKRGLVKGGFIDTEHRITDLPGHTSRASRKQNRQGFVRFNTQRDVLQLIQCDSIAVLPLKGLTERHEFRKEHTKPSAPANPVISERVRKSWITRKIEQHEAEQAA